MEAHYENRLGTLFGSPNVGGESRDCLISETLANDNDLFAFSFYLRAHTVADRVLGLDAEEEAWCKAVDVVDARIPAALGLISGQVSLFEVAVSERNEPPDDGEEHPRADEAQAEREEGPSPLRIDERRKNVLQES